MRRRETNSRGKPAFRFGVDRNVNVYFVLAHVVLVRVRSYNWTFDE